MKHLRRRLQRGLLFGLLSLSASAASAQTGKINGTVTDEGGEPLPGVNVVIEGSTQGSTTDVDGFYAILNVPPGTYRVRASFIGFAPAVQEGVRVNIDLTTTVDFAMREEAVGLEEIVVQATEPVVKRDVSASVANISAQEVENLPVTSVDEVIGMQAGTEGLRIRGGDLSQLSFRVDGLSMRSGRDNTPYTGIAYTSIDAVQVQTGGFNAEYGNVRSGLVNVVLKEGPRDRYTADVILRYAPAQQNNFGIRPDSPSAYWIRPYLDPEVAFDGTGVWDEYLQRQYPQFAGFNAVAEGRNTDEDPTNDVTSEQLQDIFEFRNRRSLEPETPSYEVDASVGGPVPAISRPLGDLRFFASYRQTQDPYTVPMRRAAYTNRVGQFKLTSNVRQNMKLQAQGIFAWEEGMAANDEGAPGILRAAQNPDPTCFGGPAGVPLECNGRPPVAGNGMDRSVLFSPDVVGLTDITRSLVGLEFTHTLSPSTFYEVIVQRNGIDYLTRPGPARDTSEVLETVAGYALNEGPFGYQQQPEDDESGSGLRLAAGQWVNGRDSSEAAIWSGRFDLTSQLNRYAQVKAGVEYLYSDYDTRQQNVGFFTPGGIYNWSRQPNQGAAYAQTKLEFKGMVANLGLRLDYYHGGGDWYVFTAFDRAFSPRFGYQELNEALEQEPTERKLYLSPRIGVSFPVTESSKFFLNYGHFRSFIEPEQAFTLRGDRFDNQVERIGNPNLPLPQTVSYELGFEQNLFDQLLLRATGYYRASEFQTRLVGFESIDGLVNYDLPQPDNYSDVRGIELTLAKNRGRWVQGFVNYTYMSVKSGNFGFGQFFENRVDQRRFERNNFNPPSAPDPRPYANANVTLILPQDLGPDVLGLRPLGDWRVSFLGFWRVSPSFTWNGGQAGIADPAFQGDNVRWTSERRLDLRFAKNVGAGTGRDVRLFIDVTNVLGLRRLYPNAFALGTQDYEYYMQSLHLPEDTFDEFDPGYVGVPGDDQPGDYRDPDVAFQPIEGVGTLPEAPEEGTERAWRWSAERGDYFRWDGSAWAEVPDGEVDRALDEKAYIDMPNEEYFWFLNPRQVRFGIRVSL